MSISVSKFKLLNLLSLLKFVVWYCKILWASVMSMDDVGPNKMSPNSSAKLHCGGQNCLHFAMSELHYR
jgi:hypothetical protein